MLPVHDHQREFQGRFATPRTATRYIVVHHAAAHYKQLTGLEDVRAIARWHTQGRGWGGIGYHEVIAEQTNGGPVAAYLVSDPETERAHVFGRNHESYGICCAVDFGAALPEQKWINALRIRIAIARARWPDAVVVGHTDIALPGRATSCPGSAWPRWRHQLDTLTPAYSADAPLLGPARGTAAAAVAWFTSRSTHYTAQSIGEIVRGYERIGTGVGVDWFLALAQCAHETGSLTSWWCARPRRNPAGIGVTGHSVAGAPDVAPGLYYAYRDGRWFEGVSFPTWEHSARAHLGRLLAYALPPGVGTPAQRELMDEALSYRPLPGRLRGAAASISDLDGRWAVPGVGYGGRVAALAERMREGR